MIQRQAGERAQEQASGKTRGIAGCYSTSSKVSVLRSHQKWHFLPKCYKSHIINSRALKNNNNNNNQQNAPIYTASELLRIG